jgi:uncharacterized protein involved in tellurium resistance
VPYEFVYADFSSIPEGMLTINSPNLKHIKIKWTNSETEQKFSKYAGCKTISEVKAVAPNGNVANDIIDGEWSDFLFDLE